MKIYVGGLPFTTTEQNLTSIFTEYGEVSDAKIIMDRETGKSKGFGFITMADDEAARKAIADLEGAELNGRTIHVNEARPEGARTGGGGGYRGGGNRGGGGGNRGGYGGGNRGGGRY